MKKLNYFSKAIFAIAMMLVVAFPTLAYDFEVDGIYYNILDETEKSVEVTFGVEKYIGSINIPSTVSYNGTDYSVISIGDNAFLCNDWKSLGMAQYTDDFIASLFEGMEPATYNVEIQANEGTPGLYRLVNPYGAAFPYNEDGDWDKTKDYYLEIDATDPQGVYIKTQELGFDWGYGEFLVSSAAAQLLADYDLETIKAAGGYCGTLVDGVITFPEKALLVSATGLDGWYYANVNGAFKVVLPSATANTSKSVDAVDNKTIATIKSSKKFNENAQKMEQVRALEKTMPKVLKSNKSIKSRTFSTDLQKIALNINRKNTLSNNSSESTSQLTYVTIPNSVTKIGSNAFYDCHGLSSITIPNSVVSIGECAFKGCTGLTSVTIGNSITSISRGAFEDCTGMTEVNISDLSAWCKIDFSNDYSNPLYYAKKLNLNGTEIKDLVIPNDITEIKQYAFYNYTSLKSVTIPNSVTEIGYRAFYSCGIRLIMSHGAVPPICDGGAFWGNYTALLMIPEGSLIDYALADEWHKFTQVHEVSEATVSTQEQNATFEIPTIEGATKYDVTVYSDISMTQLVATTHYDAAGKIVPMSTTLELSIDGFDDGVYYYKVLVKSADGEILNNYIGTFEIEAAGVEDVEADNGVIEVARYDIYGHLLSEPTKGINIVKYSDGTTRKECVKK